VNEALNCINTGNHIVVVGGQIRDLATKSDGGGRDRLGLSNLSSVIVDRAFICKS
jgi:hypothetical protein